MKAAFTFTRKRKMYRGVTVMREALNLSAQLEPPPQDCCMAPIPPLPWYVGYGIILLPSQTNNAHIGGYVFPRGKRISRFVPVCVCRVWLGGKGAMRFSRACGFGHTPFCWRNVGGFDMEQPVLGTMDLNERAAIAAREHITFMPLSYRQLVKELEKDGYTHDQAVHGADSCKVDWNEQAARVAKEYMCIAPFPRQYLIGQLEYEGFTHDQAVYGVGQVDVEKA